jgi:hypothetical protein
MKTGDAISPPGAISAVACNSRLFAWRFDSFPCALDNLPRLWKSPVEEGATLPHFLQDTAPTHKGLATCSPSSNLSMALQ